MKNRKYVKITLVVAVCLAVILPFIPFNTEAVVNNFAAAGTGFKGKKLSILGDSISTYEGISNNTSYNTTIGSNAVYYSESNSYIASADETWWMQAMDILGMNLCVNNSWSGSCATDRGSGNSVAYKLNKRCVQLHNDTGSTAVNPDIIAIYMGTNDMKNITSAARITKAGGGSYAMGATMNVDGTAKFAFNFSTVTAKVNTEYTPSSILEAYALMVYRSINKYRNAEIYCFTLLPNESQNQYNREMYELYNAGIRGIVKHFYDSGKKVYLVDLYSDSGITQDLALFDLFLANTLHPNAKGMDVITNCFLSSLVANSQYSSVKFTNKVTYDLNDAYVTDGNVNSAATGNPFSVTLMPTHSEFDLNVKVTMNGADVTGSAVRAGDINKKTVMIDRVTGPIHIVAEAAYRPRNYRWESKDGVMQACVSDGNDYRVPGQIDTSELVQKEIYINGSFFGTQYQLSDPVVLRNEEPWVLEWKGTGKWSSNMLFSTLSADTTRNNSYLFFNGTTLLGLGFRKGYNNGQTGTDANGNAIYEYPGGFTNFAVSTSGLTLNSTTSHTFRLVNRVLEESNEVWLYVDHEKIGALTNYYAGNANKGVTDDWVTGKDFVFSYMGSQARPLKECDIEYIQVWEGGGFDDLRLKQLQQEFESLRTSVSGYIGFSDYLNAVNASKTPVDSQDQCDAYADAIINARNKMTQICASNTTSGEILSVELISGDYARIGKPVGLRIVTAPDVTRLSVGTEELSSVSAMVQTVNRNGQDTCVKVWMVTFNHGIVEEQSVSYSINTFLAENDTAVVTLDKMIRFQ